MNKKTFLLISVLIIGIAGPAFCLDIELKAGYQMLSMADFEAKISAINSILLLPGGTGTNDKPTACFGADLAVNTDIGGFGLKVGPRAKLLPGINFTGSYFYPDGTKSTDYISSALFLFLGTGAVYQYMFGTSFGLYGGIDLGYQMGFANDKIISYDTAGNVSDTVTTAPSTKGFGYYIKLGAKYHFNPGFAALAELNYNNLGESLYAGTGLALSFGGAEKPSGQDTGGYVKLVQTANALFSAKNFTKAASYYMSALKFKKEAAVYKYLGHCFYHTKQFAKARWCYERSLELKKDSGLAGLAAKLKAGGY